MQRPGKCWEQHVLGRENSKCGGPRQGKSLASSGKIASIINIVNDEKVNRMNKAFVDIQKELAHFSRCLSLEPLQKQLIPPQCQENEPVNVDEATRLMAQL
uniref:Ribosomal biosis factor n=1 Tax=Equus caballus TaxID=9796 RepID=A0A5F5PK77_HORSE